MLTVSTTLTRSSAEAHSVDCKAHLDRGPFCLPISSQQRGSAETGYFCRPSTLRWTLVTGQFATDATFYREDLNLTRALANLDERIFTMGLTFYTRAVKRLVPLSSGLTSTWSALEKEDLWHECMMSRLLFWWTYTAASCAWPAVPPEWGWHSYKATIPPSSSGARYRNCWQMLQVAVFKGRTTIVNNAFCNPAILAAHPYNSAETLFSPDKRKSLWEVDQTGTVRAPDLQQPSADEVWSVILDLQCKKCSVGTP